MALQNSTVPADQLTPRSVILATLRGTEPGSRASFPFPEGMNPTPAERETFRRRVHSAAHAAFGPGSYRCEGGEHSIAVVHLVAPRAKRGA